ncbi:MAG: hypothetical protein JWM53_2784 [bacterium]|nr:hypothetical protein [bacterium]
MYLARYPAHMMRMVVAALALAGWSAASADEPSLRVQFAARTDTGTIHEANDNYFSINEKSALFVVADGRNGMGAEAATKRAAESLMTDYPEAAQGRGPCDAPAATGRQLLCVVARAVARESVPVAITAVVVVGRRLLFAQHGAVGLVVWRGGKLRHETSGEGALELREGDAALIYSRGVAASGDATLVRELTTTPSDAESLVDRLIAAARAIPNRDDATVIALRFRPQDGSPLPPLKIDGKPVSR